jgi:hypothetical protein
MKSKIFVTSILALVVALPTQYIYASSFWSDLGNTLDTADANWDAGLEAGRDAGVDDRQDGKESDSECPANDSHICMAYHYTC